MGAGSAKEYGFHLVDKFLVLFDNTKSYLKLTILDLFYLNAFDKTLLH